MKFALTLLFVFTLAQSVAAQEPTEHDRDFRIILEEVQQGFETGNVNEFSSHFASQVQVNLRGSESGYYSSNHAFFIVQKFLKDRKVLSFEFTHVSESFPTPYAAGSAVFSHKGSRENLQVYVSLMDAGGRWVIAEINIY